MEIVKSKKFKKEFKKLPEFIKNSFEKRIALFLSDEFNSILHNHKLNPPWEGYRSIDITGDVRLIYENKINGYGFVRIGTHSELYQ